MKRMPQYLVILLVIWGSLAVEGLSASITFSSRSSAIELKSGANFTVGSAITGVKGLIIKDANATISGSNISFDCGMFEEDRNAVVLTGDLNSTSGNFVLNGDKRLRLEPGISAKGISISGTGNRLEGQPVLTSAISFDANATLTLAIQSSLNQNIQFDSGGTNTILLDSDVSLADDVTIVNNGTIDINGRAFSFGGKNLTFANTIYWLNAGDTRLWSKTTHNGTWSYNAESRVNANGNVIDVSGGGVFDIKASVTLHIADAVLIGVTDSTFVFGNNGSTVNLSNVIIQIDEDISFSKGRFYVDGPTTFVMHDHDWTFGTDSKLTISAVSLWLDKAGAATTGELLFGSASNYEFVNSGTYLEVGSGSVALASWVEETSDAMDYWATYIEANSNWVNLYGDLVIENSSAVDYWATFVEANSNWVNSYGDLVLENSGAVDYWATFVEANSNWINLYGDLVLENSAAIAAGGGLPSYVEETSDAMAYWATFVNANSNWINSYGDLVLENSAAENYWATFVEANSNWVNSYGDLVLENSAAIAAGGGLPSYVEETSDAMAYWVTFVEANSNWVNSYGDLVLENSAAEDYWATFVEANSNWVNSYGDLVLENSAAIAAGGGLPSYVEETSDAMAYWATFVEANSNWVNSYGDLVLENSAAEDYWATFVEANSNWINSYGDLVLENSAVEDYWATFVEANSNWINQYGDLVIETSDAMDYWGDIIKGNSDCVAANCDLIVENSTWINLYGDLVIENSNWIAAGGGLPAYVEETSDAMHYWATFVEANSNWINLYGDLVIETSDAMDYWGDIIKGNSDCVAANCDLIVENSTWINLYGDLVIENSNWIAAGGGLPAYVEETSDAMHYWATFVEANSNWINLYGDLVIETSDAMDYWSDVIKGNNVVLTSELNSTVGNLVLDGNKRLRLDAGITADGISVSNSNNRLEGQPILSSAITFDANATLTLAIHGSLNQNIQFDAGGTNTILLEGDVSLSDDVTIVNDGTVDINGRVFSFGGKNLTFANTIYWLNAGDTRLWSKTIHNGTWNYNAESRLNANCNVIDVSGGGVFDLKASVTLHIADAIIVGMTDSTFVFGDDGSTVNLSNVTIQIDDDISFSQGRFYIDGPTTFVLHDHNWTFGVNSKLIINDLSLWLDKAGAATIGELLFDSASNYEFVNSGTYLEVGAGLASLVEANSNWVNATAPLGSIVDLIRSNSNWIDAYGDLVLENSSAVDYWATFVEANSNWINLYGDLVIETSDAMDYWGDIIKGNSDCVAANCDLIVENSTWINLYGDLVIENSNWIDENSGGVGIPAYVEETSDAMHYWATFIEANSNWINLYGDLVIETSDAMDYWGDIIKGNSDCVAANCDLIVENSTWINLYGDLVIENSNWIDENSAGPGIPSWVEETSDAMDYWADIIKGNSDCVAANCELIVENSNWIAAYGDLVIENSNTIINIYNLLGDDVHLLPGEFVEFNSDQTLDGDGRMYVFSTWDQPQFIIGDGVTLTLKNIELIRINANTFSLGEGAKLVIDENVLFELNEDLVWNYGSFQIAGDDTVFTVRGLGKNKKLTFYKGCCNRDWEFDLGTNTLCLHNVELDGLHLLDYSSRLRDRTLPQVGAIALAGDSVVNVRYATRMNFVVSGHNNQLSLRNNNIWLMGSLSYGDLFDNELKIKFLLEDMNGQTLQVIFGEDFAYISSVAGLARLIFTDSTVQVLNKSESSFVLGRRAYLGGQNVEILDYPIKQISPDVIFDPDLNLTSNCDNAIEQEFFLSPFEFGRALRRPTTAFHNAGMKFKGSSLENEFGEIDFEEILKSVRGFSKCGDLHINSSAIKLSKAKNAICVNRGKISDFGVSADEQLKLTMINGATIEQENHDVELKEFDKIFVEGANNKIIVKKNFVIKGSLLFDEGAELTFEFGQGRTIPEIYFDSTTNKLLQISKGASLIFKGRGKVRFSDGYTIYFDGEQNGKSSGLVIQDLAEMIFDDGAEFCVSGDGQILVHNKGKLHVGENRHVIVGLHESDVIDIAVDREGEIFVEAVRGQQEGVFSMQLGSYTIDISNKGRLHVGRNGLFEINSLDRVEKRGYLSSFLFHGEGKLKVDEGGLILFGRNKNHCVTKNELELLWDNVEGIVTLGGMIGFPVGGFVGKLQDVRFGSEMITADLLVSRCLNTASNLFVSIFFVDEHGASKLRTKNGVIVDLLAGDEVLGDAPESGNISVVNRGEPFIITADGQRI